MKRFHPFFIVGTLGMLITSLLHICMAIFAIRSFSHASFISIYPVFVTFVILGIILTYNKQKLSEW